MLISKPEDSNKKEVDGYSIVDILVFFIRWRIFFLISLLISILIGIAVFVLDVQENRNESLSGKDYETNATVLVNQDIGTICDLQSMTDIASQLLLDPKTILSALKSAEITEFGGIDISEATEENALFYIRRRLVQNRSYRGIPLQSDQKIYSVIKFYGNLQVMFKSNDKEKSLRFMEGLLGLVQSKFREVILPIATGIALAFENESQKYYSPEKPNISENFRLYVTARRYLEKDISLISFITDPYVILPENRIEDQAKGALSSAALVAIALLLFSIFSAVLLQYCHAIFKPQMARNKIRDAFNKSADR